MQDNKEISSVQNNKREDELEYIRIEDRIYNVATDKEIIDWKSFLYDLIYREGLNPWDIDLGILTKKYLLALKELKEVDFNISGKFLTVAVYLLKTKSEKLLDSDLRGFEDEIQNISAEEGIDYEEFDEINEFENNLEDNEPKKKEYKLKFRNPIARKRKVNIFDLIKTLEKTFEQSNKRRANFLQRKADVNYDGPIYEKRKKDLKEIIEDLFQMISEEFQSKSGHITFSHISKESKHKLDVIEHFIPLLHLHNQNRVELKQKKHFDDIEIHKVSD